MSQVVVYAGEAAVGGIEAYEAYQAAKKAKTAAEATSRIVKAGVVAATLKEAYDAYKDVKEHIGLSSSSSSSSNMPAMPDEMLKAEIDRKPDAKYFRLEHPVSHMSNFTDILPVDYLGNKPGGQTTICVCCPGPEIKGHSIYNFPDSTLGASIFCHEGVSKCLSQIAQGTDENERIGRRIQVVAIELKMMIRTAALNTSPFSTSWSPWDCLRVILHTSKKPSTEFNAIHGSDPTTSACAWTTGIIERQSTENGRSMGMTIMGTEQNYKILWDKTFCVGAARGDTIVESTDIGRDLTFQAQHVDIQIPINETITYQDTFGTQNFQTNGLWMTMFGMWKNPMLAPGTGGSQAMWQPTYNVRIRYTDV